MIPNLGLRLVFPSSQARSLVLAVTNPLFHATVLPRGGGVVLTAGGGFHHHYCTNVFAALGAYRVSLFVCTAYAPHRYTSDLLFVMPRAPGPPPVVRHAPWAALAARLAWTRPRVHPIRKRAAAQWAVGQVALDVRSRVAAGAHEVFTVRIRTQSRQIRILGLALYAGRPWRVLRSHFYCSAPAGTAVRCVVIAPRGRPPVGHWHMVLAASGGSLRVSW